MDPGDQPIRVTQREFYSALTLVWTYIMLVIATAISGPPSRFRTTITVVYWAVSVLMVFNYGAASWRGGVPRKGVVVAVGLALAAVVVGVAAFFTGGWLL